jgi:ferrochelatase
LEPDICDALEDVHQQTPQDAVIVCPIGFISDHMEVIYDLDTEARAKAEELGLTMVRAATAGTHPEFVAGLRELVLEYARGDERKAIGEHGPYAMVCPIGCCPSGRPGAESCVP